MAERGPSIFISYRGGDEPWAPDLVYTALAAEFGEGALFKAGFNLRAGDKFPPILEQHAASCRVMLVCIGPHWVAAQNADGTQRLEDGNDWVRREIEIALRKGNHVIPVLLGNRDDISVPKPEDLPTDIAPLIQRQAFRLEPGGRLRITLPDLAARVAELVPGLATRTSNAGGGTITAKMRIGKLKGKATALRAYEGVPSQIDAAVEIEDVAETGAAITVDLQPRDGAP